MTGLLHKVRAAGFSVTLEGDDIVVSPATLNDEQLACLRKHKPEIVQELRSAANLPVLPRDLQRLAERHCLEVRHQTPDEVFQMHEDLAHVPDDWPRWAAYFKQNLGIPESVQCAECRNCEPVTAGLGRCLSGVPSPGACGSWWMTDQHSCLEFRGKNES